jgi:predicted small secreted protein
MGMNLKTFVIGAAVGLLGGYVLKNISAQKVDPEKILDQIKRHFKKQGPIQGSWIHTEVEPYENGTFRYQVYKGGISRQMNGENEQYEFIADASTGTILDVRLLTL